MWTLDENRGIRKSANLLLAGRSRSTFGWGELCRHASDRRVIHASVRRKRRNSLVADDAARVGYFDIADSDRSDDDAATATSTCFLRALERELVQFGE